MLIKETFELEEGGMKEGKEPGAKKVSTCSKLKAWGAHRMGYGGSMWGWEGAVGCRKDSPSLDVGPTHSANMQCCPEASQASSQ
jgi:hypothetical protein